MQECRNKNIPMKIKVAFIGLCIYAISHKTTIAQDLLSMLDSIDNEQPRTEYTTGTFKSVRLINGYTGEIAGENELVFSISHRFGMLNTGLYELFGLDQSTIRFGFEYGINPWLDLGVGRSNYEKLYDGFFKFKLLKQSSGTKNIPISITLLEGLAAKTQKWTNADIDYPLTARFDYVHELFIYKKFTDEFSMQLVPVLVHRNLVPKRNDENDVGALGVGGRYKLAKRFVFSGEYFYLFPGETAENFHNSLSLGFEIETGGHVFQLNFSNSSGMTEKIFVPETTGRWLDGEIHFGFNIIRVFGLKKHK